MILAILAAAMVLAAADPPTAHVMAREPDRAAPTTASLTARRLDQMAEQLHLANVGAPRVAIFDVAWPNSVDESEALGRNGVLQVTAVAADATELPVRRVYVRDDDGEHELQRIGGLAMAVPETAAVHAVGAFREDSYYLLPEGLGAQRGMVLIDFTQHRKEFDLTPLPLGPPNYSTTEAAPHIDPAVLAAFVKREFKEAPGVSLTP